MKQGTTKRQTGLPDISPSEAKDRDYARIANRSDWLRHSSNLVRHVAATRQCTRQSRRKPLPHDNLTGVVHSVLKRKSNTSTSRDGLHQFCGSPCRLNFRRTEYAYQANSHPSPERQQTLLTVCTQCVPALQKSAQSHRQQTPKY